jgi:cell division cycle 2-like protein
MLHQILAGIQHVHSKWLLHRDLKTSNVLIHKSGRIALADFGLARKYQDPLQPLTQMVITLWYRPPELLFGETIYGPAVDMWSVGCILGELITKEAILQGEGEIDQIDKIFSLVGTPNDNNWPDFDKLPSAGILRWKSIKSGCDLSRRFPVNSFAGGRTFLDANGFDLLRRLLTLDPKKRITADEAMQHSYFCKGVPKAAPSFAFDKT